VIDNNYIVYTHITVYVGPTDRVQCGFESPGSCPWQLVEGTVMRAGPGSLSMDAAGSRQGTGISTMTISSVSMTMSLLVFCIQSVPCTTLSPQKCILVNRQSSVINTVLIRIKTKLIFDWC